MQSCDKVVKFCKKCKSNTLFRMVKSVRDGNNYRCAECMSDADKKCRIKYWWKYLATKANSRNRENSIKLTKEHIEALAIKQNFKCALTGHPFDVYNKWWKGSLDRIDSSKGYTLDNIQLVAWIVNHCKGNLTDNEFIDMCDQVAKYAILPHSSSKN